MTKNQKIGVTVAGVGLVVIGIAAAAHALRPRPRWNMMDVMQARRAEIPNVSVIGTIIGGEIGTTG